MRNKRQSKVDIFRVIDPQNAAAMVAAIALGDERAQASLFSRYQRPLLVILLRSVESRDIAEELCQETFRITFQKILRGELREPEKLPGFMWSVAQKLAIEHFRKLPPQPPADLESIASLHDPAPDPLEQLLDKEADLLVRRLLGDLRFKRDSEVLYRFYVAEEDKQQICDDLQLTTYQFNLILFRARERYRSLYEEMKGKVKPRRK
jgi:RNA polymerase sigma-70 factor, ECF subfamily